MITMAVDKKQTTAAEIKAVADEWQPAPGSALALALAAVDEAVSARDREFVRLSELKTEVSALEAALAAALGAGDVDAAAEADGRLTAVRTMRAQAYERHLAAGQKVGVLAARVDTLVGELNWTAHIEARAQQELARAQRELGEQIDAARAARGRIVGGL